MALWGQNKPFDCEKFCANTLVKGELQDPVSDSFIGRVVSIAIRFRFCLHTCTKTLRRNSDGLRVSDPGLKTEEGLFTSCI